MSAPRASILSLDQVTSPPLLQVVAVWRRVRGGRVMPRRADILPEDIATALGWVNLLEVRDTPPRFRFRLVGSMIAEVQGRDYTNCTIDDIALRNIAPQSLRPIKRRWPPRRRSPQHILGKPGRRFELCQSVRAILGGWRESQHAADLHDREPRLEQSAERRLTVRRQHRHR